MKMAWFYKRLFFEVVMVMVKVKKKQVVIVVVKNKKNIKALLDAKLLAKLFSKVTKNNLIYLTVYRIFYRNNF